jgi:hypothetical protein
VTWVESAFRNLGTVRCQSTAFRIDCFGALGVAKRYELFEAQQRGTSELLPSEAGDLA